MKKILIVSDYFPPSTKGGGLLSGIPNIIDFFSDRYSFFVLTSNMDVGARIPYDTVPTNTWCVYKRYHVFYANPEFIRGREFSSFLNVFDAIFCTGIFSLAVRRICYLNARHLILPKIGLGPMGCLCPGALAVKKEKKKMFLFLANLFRWYSDVSFVFSSQADAIQSMAAVKHNKKDFFIAAELPTIFSEIPVQKEKHIPTKIVYLSRIVPKKNLLFAIKALAGVASPIIFDVFGNIEDSAYWSQCLLESKKLPENIVFRYCGFANDPRMIFSDYDYFCFPTLSENYGYVVLESLSAGTPVLLSNTTYWNFLGSDDGCFVKSLDSLEEWQKLFAFAASITPEEYSRCSKNAFRSYQNEVEKAKKSSGYLSVFSYLVLPKEAKK